MGDVNGEGDNNVQCSSNSDSTAALYLEEGDHKFDSVVGHDLAKEQLTEAFTLPILFPQLFRNLRFPNHSLIYGPPGVGKTYLTKALGHQIRSSRPGQKCDVFRLHGHDIFSRNVSIDADVFVKDLLEKIDQNYTNPIVIIDDAETLFYDDSDLYRKVQSEILSKMREARSYGFILITSEPWRIHAAIRRKCSRRIYLDFPNFSERVSLFKKFLATSKTIHGLTDMDFDEAGLQTSGFTGADICSIARDVEMCPLRRLQTQIANLEITTDDITEEYIENVTSDDLHQCLHKSLASVDQGWMEKMHEYNLLYNYELECSTKKEEIKLLAPQDLAVQSCQQVAKLIKSNYKFQTLSIQMGKAQLLPLPWKLRIEVMKVINNGA